MSEQPPGSPLSEQPQAEPMTEQQEATYAELASELEQVDTDAPVVGIVMGSKSDMPAMEGAEKELEERGIRSE
ncbi:MAG: hypothetical protein JOY58_06345, partial [Solirubrobacterales bacterium]|nr:hypothetical protein [Solirubrobacterales bacterium]